MNRVNYFVIAEGVVNSSQGVTLINVFNRLHAKALPLKNPKISIAFGFYPNAKKLEANDNKVKITIKVFDPNNLEIASIVGTGKKDPSLNEKDPELAGAVDLMDIELQLPGVYRIKLICEKDVIAENKFTVEEGN